ncbi:MULTISPECIES: leucyl aminopeptidase [Leeia]|uniref:Probable cytosol aminopeptidase n=1 Tax=Leeia aquatica TaxID=2725557 RepID=A0A847SH50_9NEIS|nr:leucyl aminopeptidase [Leeia aquatica]NLR75252.1 leucyl aminopeptidase [Leeia aquatica]
MEFSIKTGAADKQAVGCVVVGVFEDGKLSAAAKAVDTASGGALKAALADGDISGKAGSSLLLRGLANVAATRVLLVGLGKDSKQVSDKDLLDGLSAAFAALLESGSRDAAVFLSEEAADAGMALQQAMLLLASARYRFDQFKSKPAENRQNLHALHFFVGKKDVAAAEQGLRLGQAVSAGVNLTKDLGNMPPNVCTPSYLAGVAQELAQQYSLSVEVLETADMEKLGMGSLLSVAKGSVVPPRLVVLKYSGGGKKDKPVVLVGKGITFDSGGISLKPGEGMDEMKYDMCGAGTVLGVMKAVSEAQLPINVIGVVVAAENMPAGNASKPSDIVTSMSGQTIEILNTDAEGRLILCDALTYVERFDPAAVIDIATLTGACVIALGHINTGLFANDDDLANELLASASATRDWAWRMPVQAEYDDALKSNFADMANVGSRAGGSVTAAMFLNRYTKAYKWAHLDIAGTAWKSGPAKGATGRPVPLLVNFLRQRAQTKSKKG